MESFGIRVYKEYFNFAAAHFLIFEDGTREELHGHNYQVQVGIEGVLDTQTDVFIDFLHIKPIVKAVCDSIDHHTLLPQFSRFLSLTLEEARVEARFQGTNDYWTFPRRDVVVLPIPNTSVERLAQYLCKQTLIQLNEQYPKAKIRQVTFEVEESRGQCAVYRLDLPTAQYLNEVIASASAAV